MTMISRHMNELQYQQPQPSRERRTVWKKVVSTLNCCGYSRSRVYENGDLYQPNPYFSSISTPQQHTGHATHNQEEISSRSLTTQSVQSKRSSVKPKSLTATPKSQRKPQKYSFSRKLSSSSKRREVAIIQPTTGLLNKLRHGTYKHSETNKLQKPSRGIDLKNVSTIIKYAKSISISTLHSLSPENGKESFTDIFTLQKGVIESLSVKLPHGSSHIPAPRDRSAAYRIGQELDRLPNSQMSPSNADRGVLGSQAESSRVVGQPSSAACKQLEDRQGYIIFANTVNRECVCVPGTAFQRSSSSPESCDVTQIPINVGKVPNAQKKGELYSVAQRAPTKPHIYTKMPVMCERPLLHSSFITQGESVSRQGLHPTIVREDIEVSHVDDVVTGTGAEVDTDEGATKPPQVTARQLNDVQQSLLIKTQDVILNSFHLLPNVQNGDNQIAERNIAGQADVQGSQEVECEARQDNGEKSCNPADTLIDGNEEAGLVAIKSQQTTEKKILSEQAPPTLKNSNLRRLYPECKLLSQGDLQHVVHPNTNKVITLGKGSFGVVSLMKNTQNGKLCAVKTFKDHLVRRRILKETKREVEMLTNLRGLNCVPELYGIVPAEGNTAVPSVVKEFIGDAKSFKSSTLEAALVKNILSVASLYHIALNLVKALIDIHSRRILHCDLKVDNVMLMPGFEDQRVPQIKIIDFGRATNMDHKPRYERYTTEKQQRILTRSSHVAPEVVLGKAPHTEYSEIYSLGVMFLCMAGDQLKYLQNAGNKCVDENFFQRPTLNKIKGKLTEYIQRKQW